MTDPYIHATELRCEAEGASRADLGEETFADRVEYWRHSGLSPEQVAAPERVHVKRKDIRPGDIIRVSGWFVNTVDELEWIPGHTPTGKALRITGWRIADKYSSSNGYGSTTVLWERSGDIELLARGAPKCRPGAFEMYEELRREDP